MKLSAQQQEPAHRQKVSFNIEVAKPVWETEGDISFPTSAVFLSVRLPSSSTLTVLGELPFAHYGFEDDAGSNSQTLIGNPYFGFEFHNPGASTFWEIGVRPALAQDDKEDAMLVGTFSDFERTEAFVPDVLSISGALTYEKKHGSNVFLHLRGGPSFWFLNTEDATDDSEVWLDYRAQVGYQNDTIRILGGVLGSFWLTHNDELGLERTVYQLGFSANVSKGKVRPGVQVRVPLNTNDHSFLEDLDFVIGLNLSMDVN